MRPLLWSSHHEATPGLSTLLFLVSFLVFLVPSPSPSPSPSCTTVHNNNIFFQKRRHKGRHKHTKGSNNKDTAVVIWDDNPSLRIHANTHRTPMTSDGNILDKSSICLEYSDWVCGDAIGNQNVVIRINEEVAWGRKLANTNMTNKITLGIKD